MISRQPSQQNPADEYFEVLLLDLKSQGKIHAECHFLDSYFMKNSFLLMLDYKYTHNTTLDLFSEHWIFPVSVLPNFNTNLLIFRDVMIQKKIALFMSLGYVEPLIEVTELHSLN